MSRVLVLSGHEVERLLPMAECIPVMEEALKALARGEVDQPLRSKLMPSGGEGLLGLMPAWRGGKKPVFGLKEVCVFPGNPARGLDTHLGAVLLHSGETGELLAIMNAAAITAIRTAAVSAVATRLLSRPDSTRLAVIGAGVQARSHVAAMRCVRNINEIKVFSRSGAKGLGQEAASVEEAVADADIIVTATSAREPVLQGEWVRPGTHINAVGSSIPTARELSSSVVASASLFVDRRESTIRESGDYLFALQEGAIGGPEHIRGEIGELLLGKGGGRQSTEEVTLFKSLGLAVEDVAAGAYLFEKARKEGTGTWVEF